MVHRLTPRATVSASVDAVYQNQPDFLADQRPHGECDTELFERGRQAKLHLCLDPALFHRHLLRFPGATTQNSSSGGNLIVNTYGNQFRYAVSRAEYGDCRGAAVAKFLRLSQANSDSPDTFFLVGLDSILSPRLRTTFSTGEELGSFSSGGSTALPYLESSTSLALPRGGLLLWTNRYGLEDSNASTRQHHQLPHRPLPREPLGAKLSASLSVAYNYLQIKDRVTNANSSNQTQFQTWRQPPVPGQPPAFLQPELYLA